MLQLKIIREEKQRIINGLRKRNWTAKQIKVIDRIIETDELRRSINHAIADGGR
mgnify:CR=1 FL=1